MLAQAEHDLQALAVVVTTSEEVAKKIPGELELQLGELSRHEIARKALENHGIILIATDLEEAVDLVFGRLGRVRPTNERYRYR